MVKQSDGWIRVECLALVGQRFFQHNRCAILPFEEIAIIAVSRSTGRSGFANTLKVNGKRIIKQTGAKLRPVPTWNKACVVNLTRNGTDLTIYLHSNRVRKLLPIRVKDQLMPVSVGNCLRSAKL